MLQFVQNGNRTLNVQVNGSSVAGISREGDQFKVHSADETVLAHGSFADLASAKKYVAEAFGASAPAPAPASKRVDATEKRERTPRKNTSAPASKRASKQAEIIPAPKKARNVSEVMLRNLAEAEAGNLEIFVDDPAHMEIIRAKFSKLVAGGYLYKNGTGNIYPSKRVAARVAALVPNTNTATQIALGGWRNWRKSLRKSAPVAA
jgi:hypothetical protein